MKHQLDAALTACAEHLSPAVEMRVLTSWRNIGQADWLNKADIAQILTEERREIWPSCNRASKVVFWRAASRGLRLMNTVPTPRASQPMTGQPATSDLDTKYTHCAAFNGC